ncbi:hypothetical protein RJ640_030186, partial [Escallonia rubra]
MGGFLSGLRACLTKRLRRGAATVGEDAGDDDSGSDLFFELRSLEIATNFFSDLNQLGHGGFGPVYK